jgi:PPM family protein phosphatase
MKTGVCSDTGRIREVNQDDYLIAENGYCLYIVADGMGGHRCGEVASRLAVSAVQEHVKKYMTPQLDKTAVTGILYEAFHRANQKILQYARMEPSCEGMGTTLTLMYFSHKQSIIGHIGDSRAYMMNHNTFQQVTEDHSLVAELYRRGEITEQEAMNHPQKHVITRALGITDTVRVDFIPLNLVNDDTVLLCTDGLTNLVQDKEIEEIIRISATEDEAAGKLVSLAIHRGGYDNITALIVKVEYDLKESR